MSAPGIDTDEPHTEMRFAVVSWGRAKMKAYGSVARRPLPGEIGPVSTGGDQHRNLSTDYLARTDYASGPVPSTQGSSALVDAVARDRPCLVDAKILIVDDCALHRDGLVAALVANGTPAVGCAWDLSTLVPAMREIDADIVLLNTATRDSETLLRAALVADPQVRVVVLGVSDDDESEIIAYAEAGVAGYHTRAESFDDLMDLLKKVAAGESCCSPRVSAILLRRLSTLAAQQASVPRELGLTTREAQILDMLRLGLSNRDIADRLCIAVHTVKNHVHSVLTKLRVGTRAEAVTLAHSLRVGAVLLED